MSTATLMPVEEYLGLTGKPWREYREGVVSTKAMPTKLHARVQRILMRLLEDQGVEPFPELTLQLSETRFLIPDVAVVHEEFDGPYPTEPVLLCCEILSPEDRLGAMLSKCEEYHAWGVPYCWVIDPIKQSAWEYPAAGEPARVVTNLQAGKLAVSLERLFPPQSAD